MPAVSIIVPVYNAEKYLPRCVNSILAQTFADFELLLIEDGSPDRCGIICDEYAVKDCRVRVFHKKNGGVSSARNVGLDNAQGEYVMFCDSDDFVAENWIERLIALISSKKVDIALCGISLLNNQLSPINAWHFSQNNIDILPLNKLHTLILSGMHAAVWNKIWKKEIIDRVSLRFRPEISCNEDAIFFLQYMQNCSCGIGIDNNCTYSYIKGYEDSLSIKYHPHYWDIKKVYYAQSRLALLHCVGDFSICESAFYTDMTTGISATINKILSDSNPNNLVDKYKECSAILHSEDCKTAFTKGEFVGFHPLYRFVLKTRSFLLIYLFHCVLKIKHN